MIARDLTEFAAIAGASGALLGLDLGTRTIGVAASDGLRMVASAVETIRRRTLALDAARVRDIATRKRAAGLILGLPRNMDGTYGPAAEKANRFIQALHQEIDVPVTTWDERLSSVQANRVLLQADVSRKKRKGRVDKMAAAIVLQSYLDSVQRRTMP